MDIYEYYQRNLMIEQSIFEANYICEYRLALADTVPINEGIGDIFSAIIDFISSIIEKIRNMFSAVADFFWSSNIEAPCFVRCCEMNKKVTPFFFKSSTYLL